MTLEQKRPLLSVIVPVYNEEGTVQQLIDKIKRVDIDKEIIVVNDGSTDGTKKVLEGISGIEKTHHFEINRGKGAAIRKGLDLVSGEIVIIQDADLELDPGEYPRLIAPIIDGKSSVVYGSRFLDPSNRFPFLSGFANRFLSMLTTLLYGHKVTDMETCYKVFKSSIRKKFSLKSDRFDIEPEFTAKFLKNGFSIHEVPIRYNPRDNRGGKKIRFKDGVVAVWTLFKYRFFDDN